MFGRKSENEKRLDAAKVDLAAARAKLSAIDAKEGDAQASGTAFAAWSEEQNAAATGVERLERLTAALIARGEAARQHDAEEAMRRRIADARKANDALAARIRTDGARLLTELKTLMRDVAKATIETNALNANLPAGEPAITIADFMARDTLAFPRSDIRTEELSLWVLRDSGLLVGNQDNVTASDDGTGFFNSNNMRFTCVKRRFKSTTFHPAFVSDHPGHLFAQVRLPRFDAPGLSFDGSFLTIEAVAALEVEPAKPAKQARRQVQTELSPLDEWPPAGIASAAEDRT